MSLTSRDFLTLARTAAALADDKKADDVRLWDVRALAAVSDYYLVATADSFPQLQALRDGIDGGIKSRFGVDPLHVEGRGRAQWVVMDYGGLVIHLMHRPARAFYDLERLWTGAKPVSWETPPAESGRGAAKPPAPKSAPRRSKPRTARK